MPAFVVSLTGCAGSRTRHHEHTKMILSAEGLHTDQALVASATSSTDGSDLWNLDIMLVQLLIGSVTLVARYSRYRESTCPHITLLQCKVTLLSWGTRICCSQKHIVSRKSFPYLVHSHRIQVDATQSPAPRNLTTSRHQYARQYPARESKRRKIEYA